MFVVDVVLFIEVVEQNRYDEVFFFVVGIIVVELGVSGQ